MKPETISHYGENAHFICDKCNDSITTTTSSSQRLTNGGIKIKSSGSSETDYRDFVNVPSKLNTTPTKDTTVVNAIRYFEEKQQPPSQTHRISKLVEHDSYLSSQINGKEEMILLSTYIFHRDFLFLIVQFHLEIRIQQSKNKESL